ncbi:hypothetical protein [Streptomyces cahuitamycinicus]|uniref:Transposase n=1 Tax=Streptomyces cahuitamycinicus TaxID=2070367 RepID=A0A2N8TU25_9ACTN|nr:hypothetical protein [Streptomyces cahuitamycinicus]PNG22507.1 hypothetical protein C1J00_09070 [Streptomyces cahuitamycinicus]
MRGERDGGCAGSGQSQVELYAALRRDSRDGMSNRALECKYGVTWSTVNKALTSAWPQPRMTTASARPSKLDPFTLLIDESPAHCSGRDQETAPYRHPGSTAV